MTDDEHSLHYTYTKMVMIDVEVAALLQWQETRHVNIHDGLTKHSRGGIYTTSLEKLSILSRHVTERACGADVINTGQSAGIILTRCNYPGH